MWVQMTSKRWFYVRWCSPRLSGGNQVDGLPPVWHLRQFRYNVTWCEALSSVSWYHHAKPESFWKFVFLKCSWQCGFMYTNRGRARKHLTSISGVYVYMVRFPWISPFGGFAWWHAACYLEHHLDCAKSLQRALGLATSLLFILPLEHKLQK